MNKKYVLCYADITDIDSWTGMIAGIRDNFPGLETVEQLDSYRQTVIRNIERQTALCVKYSDEVVGVLIFSYHSRCLSCMAVHPEHRRQGIASAMIEKMLSLFPGDVDISVTTFRQEDPKGNAPRELYKKYGFREGELVIEFDYPQQKFVLPARESCSNN